jgi:hypothetical protein
MELIQPHGVSDSHVVEGPDIETLRLKRGHGCNNIVLREIDERFGVQGIDVGTNNVPVTGIRERGLVGKGVCHPLAAGLVGERIGEHDILRQGEAILKNNQYEPPGVSRREETPTTSEKTVAFCSFDADTA